MPEHNNNTPETAPEGVLWEIDFFDADEEHIQSIRLEGAQVAALRDGCGFEKNNTMFGELELDCSPNSWLAQHYKLPTETRSAFIGARATKLGVQYAGMYPCPIDAPPIDDLSKSLPKTPNDL
ncbi:MAG: hypothetical protein RLN78_10625 [Phycisphaerales bacterium]